MLNRLSLISLCAASINISARLQANEPFKQPGAPTLQLVSITDDGSLNVPLTRVRSITETRTYRVVIIKQHPEYKKNASGGLEVVDAEFKVEAETTGQVQVPLFELVEWSIRPESYRGFDTKGNQLTQDQLKQKFKTPSPAVVCRVGSVVSVEMLSLLGDSATILSVDEFEPGVVNAETPESPSPPAPAPAQNSSFGESLKKGRELFPRAAIENEKVTLERLRLDTKKPTQL